MNLKRKKRYKHIGRLLVGKRPLGRPRCRWVDNIRMDLVLERWDGVMWTGLVWLRIGTGGELL
jgi:hypothetical protein